MRDQKYRSLYFQCRSMPKRLKMSTSLVRGLKFHIGSHSNKMDSGKLVIFQREKSTRIDKKSFFLHLNVTETNLYINYDLFPNYHLLRFIRRLTLMIDIGSVFCVSILYTHIVDQYVGIFVQRFLEERQRRTDIPNSNLQGISFEMSLIYQLHLLFNY